MAVRNFLYRPHPGRPHLPALTGDDACRLTSTAGDVDITQLIDTKSAVDVLETKARFTPTLTLPQ